MIQESITNEWAEFLAYTKEPTYAVRNKKDNGFLRWICSWKTTVSRGY